MNQAKWMSLNYINSSYDSLAARGGGGERGGVSYLVTVFKGSGTQMTGVCGKHYLRPISIGEIK